MVKPKKSTRTKKQTSSKEGIRKEDNIKRLYRSRNDIMIGGVCAGIAEYTYTDPTLIRLLWVVITIITGFAPGVLAYLIAWMIMPLAPRKE